jgi:hypothetical protein
MHVIKLINSECKYVNVNYVDSVVLTEFEEFYIQLLDSIFY